MLARFRPIFSLKERTEKENYVFIKMNKNFKRFTWIVDTENKDDVSLTMITISLASSQLISETCKLRAYNQPVF